MIELRRDIMSVGFYMEQNQLFKGKKGLRVFHVILVIYCFVSQWIYVLILMAQLDPLTFDSFTNVEVIPEDDFVEFLEEYKNIDCYN